MTMAWNGKHSLLVFATTVVLVSGQKTCAYEKYVAQGEKHIMCLPKNNSCNVVPTNGVTDQDKETILNYVNELRSKVANGQQKVANGQLLPQAANMRQLIWSDELATIAQAAADQCSLKPSCYNCRTTEDYSTGEMIYYLWNSYEPQKADWTKPLTYWAGFSRTMTTIKPNLNRPYFITQMIWALTKDIGCGHTRFKTTRPIRYTDNFVCLFGPAGVNADRSAYMEGEPCSDCTYRNTCCGESCESAGVTVDYPGLCKLMSQPDE